MKYLGSLCFAIVVILAATPSFAAPFYFDESINGPISGNPAYPTMLTAGIGDNVLKGGKDNDFSGDFISFTVPVSTSVTSIVIDLPASRNDFSFAISTDTIDWQNPSTFVYFGETDGELMGLNLLTELGIGALPDGPYWFYIGPDDGDMFDYELTFSITPEPGTGIMFIVGLGAVLWRTRRAAG